MPGKDINLRVPATCRPRSAKDRDKTELTESVEEYVEGIWRLEREVATVGTGDIALYMNVAPASVTTMLKRLSELGLVEHMPYQGVKCTRKGEELAIQLLRKHRLIERLLVDYLGLPWNDVHDLACKLEHYIPSDVADRISQVLGHPTTCPHGNPIDATQDDGSRRLLDAATGGRLTVTRVSDERPEFLAYVEQAGLVPGVAVHVVQRSPFGDVMTLEVGGQEKPVSVGREVATAVWGR